MLSGSDEIFTQANPPNKLNSNAPLDSTSLTPISHLNTSQNVYSHDDENLTSHETPTLNFDYNKALVLYNDAMLKHMLSIVYQTEDVDFEFNEKTLIMLDPYFATLPTHIGEGLFAHLNCILDDLKTGIHAALQNYLLQLLMSEQLFWPGVAKHLGITPPALDIAELGDKPSFMLPSQEAKQEFTDALTTLSNHWQTQIEVNLLSRSEYDSSCYFETITRNHANRFNTSIDGNKWILEAKEAWTAEIYSATASASLDFTTETVTRNTTQLTNAFDRVGDMLILFAVKHAQHCLRALFRGIFLNKADNCAMHIQLMHFGTVWKVNKLDVPPPGHVTGKGPERTQTLNPFANTQSTTQSTTALKGYQPTQSRVSTSDTICKFDLPNGCYFHKCGYKHVSTQFILCKNIHIGCNNHARGQCKHLHPTSIQHPTPPHPRPQSSPSTQKSKGRGTPNKGPPYKPTTPGTALAPPPPWNASSLPPQQLTGKRTPTATDIEDGEELRSSFTTARAMQVSNTYNNISNQHLTNDTTFDDIETTQALGPRKRRRRHHVAPADRRLALLRLLCRNVTNIGVHVLHDCRISEEEMIVLSLGLNFCPPPRKSKSILLSDAVAKFTRQVRIKKHFATLQLDNSTAFSIEQVLHLRINKSLSLDEARQQFEPNTTHSPIESYLTHIHNTLCPQSNANTNNIKLTPVWRAYYNVVKQLGSRNDIIIKPSDKNLGVAVMDRNWYITQALTQLNNTAVYTPIETIPSTISFINDLTTIVNTQSWLPRTTSNKLLKDLIIDYTLNRIRHPRMYYLPKVHKTPTGMRPICASQGWITYWSSVYIHLAVFPLLKQIQSYVTNSAQLLLTIEDIRVKNNLPQHFQFLEADVKELFPSIPIDDGLHALKHFLIKTGMHHTQVSFLVQLTRWVLRNNYVTFGEYTYLQISGTAMGTPCAVVFACIYVHTIEREALDLFASTRYAIKCIFLFVRFLDDIIALISDHDSGLELMRLLNSRRKSIQFTFKIRNSEAQFLDLTLYKRVVRHTEHLEVKAYSKPMNKFLYLPPTSCHPRHIFNGWVIGTGRRLRQSCSVDTDYTSVSADFYSNTQARGYSEDFLRKALAAVPNRATILHMLRHKTNNNTPSIGVPFVITYSPEIQEALPAIKRALALTEVANLDPHFPQIFGCRTTPLLSFKRGPNLRDLVAPSTLRTAQTPNTI